MPTILSHYPYDHAIAGMLHYYIVPSKPDDGFFEVYLRGVFERENNIGFIHDARHYGEYEELEYKPLIYMDLKYFSPRDLIGIHVDNFGIVEEGQIIAGKLDFRFVSYETLRGIYFELLTETMKAAFMEKINV